MERRITGALLCVASAILFASRYIAAAIFMSSVTSWSRSLFEAGLEYVGSELLVASIISLAAGIGYLIWAEIEEKKKQK